MHVAIAITTPVPASAASVSVLQLRIGSVPSGTNLNKVHKRSGDTLTIPRKFKMARIEVDFIELIRGIRPKQLALLGNGLVDLAKKLEDVGYGMDLYLPVLRKC